MRGRQYNHYPVAKLRQRQFCSKFDTPLARKKSLKYVQKLEVGAGCHVTGGDEPKLKGYFFLVLFMPG